MLNDETKEALLFVLIEKVYSRYPDLMRNDTKAAEILSLYIDGVREGNHNISKITRWYNDADFEYIRTLDRIRPLLHLGPETLRKYIRHLWNIDAIAPFLEFKSCQVDDD